MTNPGSGLLVNDRPPDTRLPPYKRSFILSLWPLVLAAATCALLVTFCAALIDRPVATWVHEHLRDTRFHWFTARYDGQHLAIGPFSIMALPGEVARPIAVVVLVILAIYRAAGRPLALRGRIFLTLSLSVLAAMQCNAFLKWVFGRTWPESWLGSNPSWIRDGVFGFSPLHGGPAWTSFPSGHTTAVMTPAVILWSVWPELRPLWAAVVGVVIIGLIGGNYHFVSDIIGGLYLGTAVGLTMKGFILSPLERINWRTLFGRE